MRAIGGILVFALFCVISGCSREPRAIYFIPHGFVGWVCVYKGDPNAAPAELEGDFELFRIDRDGIARTSRPGKSGVGYIDKFFYVDDDGSRTPVPWADLGGGGTSSDRSGPRGRYVFILWIGANQRPYDGVSHDNEPPAGPPCGPRQPRR